MTKNILLRKIYVLLPTLILLLSALTYAKPFTSAFRGGLIEVNDFFTKEGYAPYAKTIDFFFFALLFIAIYMMGVKYAFKEVKKVEKTIAVLLGLMTAVLLVLGGFSVTILLPYIHWLLYFLVFLFWWWLLKGIKSYFWRFILALLLTLLTIFGASLLTTAITPPEVGAPTTFFRDFGAAFGRIQFPELPGAPGVPDYLRDLFGAPTAPTGPTTLPPTVTPTAPPAKKPFPWWIVILLLVLGALGGGGYLAYRNKDRINEWRRRGAERGIIREIDSIINNKNRAMNDIIETEKIKTRIMQSRGIRDALEELVSEVTDPAELWEKIKGINKRIDPRAILHQLANKEEELLDRLNKLKKIEVDFYNKLDQEWLPILTNLGIQNLNQDIDEIKNLIVRNVPQVRNLDLSVRGNIRRSVLLLKDAGINRLIIACHDVEESTHITVDNLQQLFQEKNVPQLIDLFIKGKYAKIYSNVEGRLRYYDIVERFIIQLLNKKIRAQINRLEELKRKIVGRIQQVQAQQAAQAAAQAQVAAQPTTIEIIQPPENHPHTLGTALQLSAQVFDQNHNPIADLTAHQNFVIEWFLAQRGGPIMPLIEQPTGNSPPINHPPFNTNPATLHAILRNTNTRDVVDRKSRNVTLVLPTVPPTTPTPTPTVPTTVPGGAVPIVSTTGTVHIRATLNGNTWPDPTIKQEKLTSEITTGTTTRRRMYVPANIINWPVGDCTAVFIDGGPTGTPPTSITPSDTQPLAPGGHITFTFNFMTPAVVPVAPAAGGTGQTQMQQLKDLLQQFGNINFRKLP